MGCLCERKKQFSYDNIKRLAQLMANDEKKTYIIYKKENKSGNNEKVFDFVEYDPHSPFLLQATEFVLPL